MNKNIAPNIKESNNAIFNIILGRSGYGKTYFMVNLINTFYLDDFDLIFIFAPTYNSERNKNNYSRLKKKAIIFTYYSAKKIEEIIESVPPYKEGNPKILIILDDCVRYFKNTLRNDDNILSTIVMNGKHKAISCFMVSHTIKNINTSIRSGATTCYLFFNTYMKEIDKFADMTVFTPKEFRKIFINRVIKSKNKFAFLTILDGDVI